MALKTNSNGLWGEQDKDSFLSYELDWSDLLGDADTIATSEWAGDAALTLNSAAVSGARTSVWVQGGVANRWYAITNTVTTAAGLRDQRTFRLFITDQASATTPDGTAVFPVREDAIAALRRDQLMLAAKTYLSGVEFSDDYLFDKLASAEAAAQRVVRCYFAPTVIIPDDASQSEIDALEAAGTRYAQEPAYDYDPNFFHGERWGYMLAQSKPIISVQSMKFAYPAPTNQLFEVPPEWIRLDRKHGHIRLVPAAMAFSAPLSAFIMQALGGGRTVPFMIQLRYTAGLKDVRKEFPDLVSAIKRMAVLSVLKDSFTPQSGSISADGLSQSVSADMDKYQDSIDKTLASVRDAIHGVRFMVI